MLPLQLADAAGDVGATRLLVGLLALSLLAIWTARRLLGEGEDPSLWVSRDSETGSASFLISGTYAVGALALVVTLALWPWMQQNIFLVVVPAAIVGAHVWFESGER